MTMFPQKDEIFRQDNASYHRKSTNQHFVAVEPIFDLHHCSRAALVYVLSSAPKRESRYDAILAKGRTGIELTCHLILDFPHKIELTSTTDELAVESSDIMTIVAKDKSANAHPLDGPLDDTLTSRDGPP
ncbi:hypothetical protein TNCT_644461 [Trichonephila clavata]|uniref:Uncharacterized protein n=1 Tax=Trichonephila clavata TaxID=2740835 RepID=A0A8X6KFE9_TRICU|nr:hypothetical protein TNCT_644461 [Trichonephila clavata]